MCFEDKIVSRLLRGGLAMRKFYARLYNGVEEEYIIQADSTKEAAKAFLAWLILRMQRGEEFPDDARWNVKPLWMAYKEGLLEGPETDYLQVLNARELIEEFQREAERPTQGPLTAEVKA